MKTLLLIPASLIALAGFLMAQSIGFRSVAFMGSAKAPDGAAAESLFTLEASKIFTVAAGTETNTISLPGTPAEGDLVFIALACDDPLDAFGIDPADGYTDIRHPADSGPGHHIAYKVMTATPDTTVGIIQCATKVTAGVIQIWSGQNATVLDVAEVNKTGISGMPDGDLITPSTAGALILNVGTVDDDDVSDVTAPSGYSSLTFTNTGQASGSVGASVMVSSKVWSSGAEDPAAYGGSGSDNWQDCMIAIRPQ